MDFFRTLFLYPYVFLNISRRLTGQHGCGDLEVLQLPADTSQP